MAAFKIKRGDTLPVLSVAFKDSAGAAYSLALASSVSMLATPFADGDGVAVTAGVVRSRDCAISSPSSDGIVTYTFVTADWGSTDTTFAAGKYELEWQVTFASGAILTFPTDDYEEMWIVEDLN